MRNKKSFGMRLAVFLFLCGLCWNAAAQQRGGDNESGAVETAGGRQAVALSGKQWAVFIAVDQYKEWEPLLYPVKDAREIKDILLEHYHINEVRELYNRDATLVNIRRLFIDLQNQTGLNDSVFIFHAGHGVNEVKTKTSAWIPYDGGENNLAQLNWLAHTQVRSMLDSIKARHVFLITDSCFSGDFLDPSRGAPLAVINYPAAYDKVSRQAMSSGGSELVDDVSEFASRLRNTLLRTETPYITPDFLLSQIKGAQTARPLSTIPILAAIPDSGHQLGGSFLFFRKNPKQTVQPPAEPPRGEDTLVIREPEPPPPVPGEAGYFVGSWMGYPDNSIDTYLISLTANGRCTVKMANDSAEQEADGNWSWDGKTKIFKLNAVFRNAKIPYMRNIEWVSPVRFAEGSNSFNILAKPSADARSNVRFTFFRE